MSEGVRARGKSGRRTRGLVITTIAEAADYSSRPLFITSRGQRLWKPVGNFGECSKFLGQLGTQCMAAKTPPPVAFWVGRYIHTRVPSQPQRIPHWNHTQAGHG